MEKQLKRDNALTLTALNVDIVVRNGREHLTSSLRTAYQHIQATLSALCAQRSKAHSHKAVRISSVANRNEDNVALIALDVLEILHEKRLVGVSVEKALRARIQA